MLDLVVWYFFVGFLCLVALDMITGRIRRKIKDSAFDAQEKMAANGNYVGRKTSILLVLCTMWLLWPVTMWGAIITIGKK